MAIPTILEIEINKFNVTEFINEICENFEQDIEPEFICAYMRPSNIEEDVYVELCEEEIEPNRVYDNYEEDLINNDRILYVKFVVDRSEWADGYLCGDGTELMDDVDYGQFVNNDNGFIIKSKDGILSIQRATYGPANPFQYVVRTVEDAGIFDENMIRFVNKHIKK